MAELRGITWNHTRGYLPMVATAQRFSELNPGVTIHWDKRSLQHFADYPLEELVGHYDLLVIDHPFVGFAAQNNVLLPLDEYLSREFLGAQADNSVGRSHESYAFAGHQWGLAIDAATPICGYRADLLEKHGVSLPSSWPELLELARRGLVAVSGIAIDSLCHFYMLCVALGEEPFSSNTAVVSSDIGIGALRMLRDLFALAAPGCEARNPIAVWELLTSQDTAAICPFAYGYSNYGRAIYCKRPLRFANLITAENGAQFRSTLGGAGLAISVHAKEKRAAADYCQFVADERCQSGLYFMSGGQPGHRAAWLDRGANEQCNYFFRDTLATLDGAWVRPRWNGYLRFQEAAGPIVHQCAWGNSEPELALDRINELLTTVRGEAA